MLQAYCSGCKKDSELLSIKEVIYVAQICRRTVYDWIRRGRLHLMEDAGGHTLICRKSLIGPYTKTDSSGDEGLSGARLSSGVSAPQLPLRRSDPKPR